MSQQVKLVNTSVPAIGNVYIAATDGRLRTFENNLKAAGYQPDERGFLTVNATDLMFQLAEKAARAMATGPCQACAEKDASFQKQVGDLQMKHQAEIDLISGQKKKLEDSFELISKERKASNEADNQLKRTNEALQQQVDASNELISTLKSTQAPDELITFRSVFSKLKKKELTITETWNLLTKIWKLGNEFPGGYLKQNDKG